MIDNKQFFPSLLTIKVPYYARFVGWRGYQILITGWEVNGVNVGVVPLKRCYFNFWKHWTFYQVNGWILWRTCKLCAFPAIAHFCDGSFMQWLFTKLFTFWRNTHRKRFAEVPCYVILIEQRFGLRLLFLASGVLYWRWGASISWAFYLFVESDREIWFLKFCWKSAKPSFVRKSLVVINRLNINFLEA